MQTNDLTLSYREICDAQTDTLFNVALGGWSSGNPMLDAHCELLQQGQKRAAIRELRCRGAEAWAAAGYAWERHETLRGELADAERQADRRLFETIGG